MSEKRNTWIKEGLATLLGTSKADETRDDLRQAADLLNGAGVESKEFTAKAEGEAPPEEQPPAPPQETAHEPKPEDGDVVAQVADKIAEDVTAAVQGDFSQLNEDKLRALLIDAMQPAAEPAESPAPEVAPGEETQMAEDKGLTEFELISANGRESIKALFETISSQTEDQGEIAKSVMRVETENAALREEVKALKPKIVELIEWKAQIEEALAMRPRASESDSTVLPADASKQAKEVLDEIEKGLQGPEKKFLGHIPVKNTPT